MATARPVEQELTADCAFRGFNDLPYQWACMSSWPGVGRAGNIYALFQEMEEKDAHLFSALQTRKNALLGCPVEVVPGDKTDAAATAARRVRSVLDSIPDFQGTLHHLLDAQAKGYSIAEILWRIERDGTVGIAAIRPRFQSDFAFDCEGLLYSLLPAAHPPVHTAGRDASRRSPVPPELVPRPGETRVWAPHARKMPDRKFLHYAFQGNAASPYGAPLCTRAYWYYWFKKNNLRHWALYNEKFGAPTAIARYSATSTPEEIQDLTDLVENLPRDRGAVLGEGVSLEFLEARRSSGGNTYRDLADWCNDEISKIVLGQTLTMSEGRRSGSLALGKVHDAIRHDYIASDAAALAQVLSDQLARWITDFNFGFDAPAPRIVFDVRDPRDFQAELQVDSELVKMGVGLPASYFYNHYRRPRPEGDERVLRYDDSNLYQYHLLYGILTINEVRKTLGLAPVPWGDHPPVPAATERSASGASGGTRIATVADGDMTEDETETNERKEDRAGK